MVGLQKQEIPHYSGHNTTFDHNSGHSPTDICLYNGLRVHCDPIIVILPLRCNSLYSSSINITFQVLHNAQWFILMMSTGH